MGDGENVTEVIRYVTRDDLFGLNTTMIIPLNAYILKMIGKLDSVDVNFSSINPISLLLFHSVVKLLALFIILYLVLHVVLMAFVICERIWRHWHDMLRTWREKAMTKAEFHTIAEKIQQIRGLQALRTANEGERKLFSQVKIFRKKTFHNV
uniref:Uncharacterized protein n=1 Tax=Wuchereria bancrofti TaxID=6293 RepID=A0AAF5PX94_WUCBA